MDRIYLGGKTIYGGIGDILYFIHKDPILQRIASQEKQEYKPELSIWNNRTANILELFDPAHFSLMIYNDDEHKHMLRPHMVVEVPSIIKDKSPKVYPVPENGFSRPVSPYFVCHLEVMEDDNELELCHSFWEMLAGMTRGVVVYLLGTQQKSLPLPENFVDVRGQTSLRQAYHLTTHADRYIGLTSVWYLLSLLLKKPGWSFNRDHKLLFQKLTRLYPDLDLINSRIQSFDIEYE